ncbi:MAG: SDR family NAD(P)-dependent oxidoreductase [Planctomycetota bacterium]|jgi:NAD(P)-dependent dehydrogenase (short-subunit alcohol dehydrogenase family)|nr:SDR family oxidoreductase [Blastopirellula sp.]
MTRVAMVTGGTSGIGLATALRQGALGHQVVIFGRSNERLEQAAAEIRAAGAAGCQTVVADFRYPQQAVQAVRSAVQAQGRCDLLVNAAAVAPLAAFEQTTAEAFDEVVNVNIRSIYLGTQAVWPVMRASGGGVIVSVSSLAAVSPFTGFSAYGASKAWLDIVTKAWADEGRAHGIRAYSVRPGAVATPMLAGLFPDFPAEQTVSADEVADVICQLALPPWRFSSGEAFTVSRQ